MRSIRCLGLVGVLCTLACVPVLPEDDSTTGELASVPTSVTVGGKSYDVESEYLPHVVQCENGAAPPEALRAQAIAARTFLTYTLRVLHRTSLRDSQADQVMSCGKEPNAAVIAAVAATKGQILIYNGPVYNASLKKTIRNQNIIIAGSFVAGSTRSGSDCSIDTPASSEKFVTVNAGLSGLDINRTIPPVASPDSPANRGAMGQNLANCIAIKKGYKAQQILKYFYGDDIQITGDSTDLTVSAPAPDDPAGQTGTGDPADETEDSPPNDVVSSDCSTGGDYPCFSALLNCAVKAGTCVLTASDKVWRQCSADGSWAELSGDKTGPEGACIASFDH